MTWNTGTLYGLDTETTGVSITDDRIITATIVKIVDGHLTDTREWLINPGIEIPPAATAVHGITTDHIRANGVHPTDALPAIRDTTAAVLRARYPLVVMNAAFDLSILEHELTRWDQPTLRDLLTPDDWHTVIDPYVLAKGLEHTLRRQYVKGRTFKLPDLCKRYGVPFTETHDATADAVGATLLAAALADDEPDFATRAPAQLHTLQKTWRREQQKSLRDYFDKKGTEHDGVDGGWPLHTALTRTEVPA